MREIIRWAGDGVIVAIVTTALFVATVVAMADKRQVATLDDHSCPEMPEEVRLAAYGDIGDAASLQASLREAIAFWEACRLGD